ncbi:hypothetical protein H310_04187 [Aphanomyces invadans]|uniref:Uncharacterized protein n=1 Tax=Aphanomyces invadans TaxID=157072 RepID=A0A024UFY6_9STRA|nr:hypothetical protein H310_04187 [Aphanomyces invadans]ETW05194.1 hypothetical protein H310_04187 [Aphanomyces invadans]|eukprot:XP_008866632.1 hypothetical protein H310_04187 [Aphanomyces invadans]
MFPPTKRAAKVKRAVTAEKSAKTVWTADMVSTLLDRRCDDFAASFELHRSAAQLSVVWGKIALAVNVQHGTNTPALAAKNKYSSLKREYSAIRMAEKETGNGPPVVYPMYWDCLVSAWGSKYGLGHVEYAFGAGRNVEESDGSDDADTERDDKKRQPIVDAEVARQRAKRPKKLDIGQSFVALGESLAEGMKGLHPTTMNDNQKQENAKLLSAIEKLQVAVEQSTSIQSELLNFLRRNN